MARLIDALVNQFKPVEAHFASSWKYQRDRTFDVNFLSRMGCEELLAVDHNPLAFEQRWTQPPPKPESQRVVEVISDTDEWNAVLTLVLEPYRYQTDLPGLQKVGRIENPEVLQRYKTCMTAVTKDMAKLEIAFEGGVHARWLFHAKQHQTVTNLRNIACNSTTRELSDNGPWGKGICFARDSSYCVAHGLAPERKKDDPAFRTVLLCLVLTGITCAGSRALKGQMPTYNGGATRYHSSVDYMCDPEIHVVTNECQVLPAYLITFGPFPPQSYS